MARKAPKKVELESVLDQLGQLLVERAREAKRASGPPAEPDWKRVEKKCKHCGETKKVDPDFGLIKGPRGTSRYPQGWCRECRASTNYRNRPRAYETKYTRGE